MFTTNHVASQTTWHHLGTKETFVFPSPINTSLTPQQTFLFTHGYIKQSREYHRSFSKPKGNNSLVLPSTYNGPCVCMLYLCAWFSEAVVDKCQNMHSAIIFIDRCTVLQCKYKRACIVILWFKVDHSGIIVACCWPLLSTDLQTCSFSGIVLRYQEKKDCK